MYFNRYQVFAFLLVAGFRSMALVPTNADEPSQERVLYTFDGEVDVEKIEKRFMTLTLSGPATDQRLQLESEVTDWPGITLRPESGVWDGSQYQHISLEVANLGSESFEFGLRVDDSGADEKAKRSMTQMTSVAPGESKTVSAEFYPTPWKFSTPITLQGMHAAPGQSNIDPANIAEVILFLRQPRTTHRLTIDNVRFRTPVKEVNADEFLPFIDEYGQFIHDDWPGKTHSPADLLAQRELEQDDLKANPGPSSFGRFGGWKDGPQHEPSKFFRAEKHDGRWWLIDPDGYRFWSHGMDAVATRFGGCGTEHREEYFRNLPTPDEELGKYYFQSSWAFGFYANRIPYRMFNFTTANLHRKYGADFSKTFDELAHQRLRSWGFNTLASWCAPSVNQQRRTPYIEFVYIHDAPVLQGAQKMWTQFHDVFDPQFRKTVAHGIEKVGYSIGDPWCLGFFVDNELYWGSEIDLALWTLRSPAEQLAKKEFIQDLRQQYETIEALNEAWGTDHTSWDVLANTTETPDVHKAGADLRAFSKKTSETYFRIVKQELAAKAPGQLYLGCRFIWDNPIAVRAACQSCDVVSFNRYTYTIDYLQLPPGEDKPMMIGEFHFGALDRGLFHPTKVPAKNQAHRAECYQTYVRTALKHPLIVGTHWFQYYDEPTAGRGDGENYQTGFLDICDTPYPEMVSASRELAQHMYETRSQKSHQ